MTRKSFKAHHPVGDQEIEVNDRVFRLNPFVPADLMLDFISGADTENPASMAKTIRSLLDAAIVPEQLDEWHEYVRSPEAGVDLNLMAEIAGYVTEVLSGNPQKAPAPVNSSVG